MYMYVVDRASFFFKLLRNNGYVYARDRRRIEERGDRETRGTFVCVCVCVCVCTWVDDWIGTKDESLEQDREKEKESKREKERRDRGR